VKASTEARSGRKLKITTPFYIPLRTTASSRAANRCNCSSTHQAISPLEKKLRKLSIIFSYHFYTSLTCHFLVA
jgi:hypothetical protein